MSLNCALINSGLYFVLLKINILFQGISDAIKSCTYKGCDPIVEAVHAQDSVMGSVIVGVTGTLTDRENVKRKFAQTYFLAPQETGGFCVHNDILHFLDVDEPKAFLSDHSEVPQAVTIKSPSALSPKNSGRFTFSLFRCFFVFDRFFFFTL